MKNSKHETHQCMWIEHTQHSELPLHDNTRDLILPNRERAREWENGTPK